MDGKFANLAVRDKVCDQQQKDTCTLGNDFPFGEGTRTGGPCVSFLRPNNSTGFTPKLKMLIFFFEPANVVLHLLRTSQWYSDNHAPCETFNFSPDETSDTTTILYRKVRKNLS